MKYSLLAASFLALTVTALPHASQASTMSRACLQSDRASASKSVCSCIQKVANQSLTRTDQRMAATFFKDPHKAQEIRQSSSNNHNDFWTRYREFGSIVVASCGHLS